MNIFKTIRTAFLALAAVLALCESCVQNDLETKGFVLYYYSMTDIGPSMAGVIAHPSFVGGTPSDFAITGVTLDGEKFEGDLFTINPSSGSISILSSKGTKTGTYSISVSCSVSGKTHNFKNVTSVRFLQAVPEGITVEPSYVEVEYGDVIGITPDAELPEAKVSTTGAEHISITGYAISSVVKDGSIVESSGLFSISEDGTVSVNVSKDFAPGQYVLNLKLNTAVADAQSSEGIYENALTINVISKPLSLSYSPNPARIEEEKESLTKFTSAVPAFLGSTENIVFSIESITPATDKIKIDPATGVLSVENGHGFKNGEIYTVNVKVVNKFSTEGVVFENALKLEVIEYIEPVSGFSYAAYDRIEALPISVKPAESLVGDYLTFEFVSISDADAQILSLNPETGEISAAKGHALSLGEHKLSIRAFNDKNSQNADVTINITANPYKFSYFSYGNNLGLTEEQTWGVSQFRVGTADELGALAASVKYSDIPEGQEVEWSLSIKNQLKNTKIDKSTGELTFSSDGLANAQTGVVFVTATVGGEDEAAISVTTPVFVNFRTTITPTGGSACTIEYTPFVLRCNPRTGGTLPAPKITGMNADDFYMDYRRTFNWYNIDGCRSDGSEHESGRSENNQKEQSFFLRNVVATYYASIGKAANYGSKDFLSYFSNQSNLSLPIAYIDNAATGADRFKLIANPGKMYDDGWGDGVLHVEVTASTSTGTINNGAKNFPAVIWFDKDFEN